MPLRAPPPAVRARCLRRHRRCLGQRIVVPYYDPLASGRSHGFPLDEIVAGAGMRALADILLAGGSRGDPRRGFERRHSAVLDADVPVPVIVDSSAAPPMRSSSRPLAVSGESPLAAALCDPRFNALWPSSASPPARTAAIDGERKARHLAAPKVTAVDTLAAGGRVPRRFCPVGSASEEQVAISSANAAVRPSKYRLRWPPGGTGAAMP